MITCSHGHPAAVVSRRFEEETIEEVVYQKERIKHFDREGSEFWAEIEVPNIIEHSAEVEVISYRCDTCGETRIVQLPKDGENAG